MTKSVTWRWRGVLAAAVALSLGGAIRSPALAQTATPGVPAGPPVDIHGEWSITRAYYQSCQGCGSPVVRTVPWVIAQTGADITIDRGLRGVVTGSGPAYLELTGLESGGFDVQRFWYGTLRVSADGNSFEGGFGGTIEMQNPCGSMPPLVTCSVWGGWIRGIRVTPRPTQPTPPGPPTAAPTATPSPTSVATATPRTTPTTIILPPLPLPDTVTPRAPAPSPVEPTSTPDGAAGRTVRPGTYRAYLPRTLVSRAASPGARPLGPNRP
jgi:hypothetical protein